MINDIEGKVIVDGKILHKYGKGSAMGATEEWASIEVEKNTLSSILSLTTKPLDEKEVEKVLKDIYVPQLPLKQDVWETLSRTICSHFSKPVIKEDKQ